MMARPISAIHKQDLTLAQQKEQTTDQLINSLLENADGIKETAKLMQELHNSGILPALGALVKAKEQMALIGAEQLLRPPVTNMINNAMAAAGGLASADPETTKKLAAGLTNGLKKAEEGLANKQTTSVWELMTAIKDPDVNRALTFGLNLLKGLGQGLQKK
jgi:uncharacterized protein YjgD (DUF1641 family)